MITFSGPLEVWTSGEGRMHFMNVPAELSAEIKGQALTARRGFGSVRVEAAVDDVSSEASSPQPAASHVSANSGAANGRNFLRMSWFSNRDGG